MSNVASLELCKELEELSGWGYRGMELTDHSWYEVSYIDPLASHETDGESAKRYEHSSVERRQKYYDKKGNGVSAIRLCPAYDLGYLLRKLPGHIALTSTTWDDIHTKKNEDQVLSYQAVACYQSNIKGHLVQKTADTPEDALCQLVIELFKQGILTQEETTHGN